MRARRTHTLADKESPEEAAFLVHVYGRGVANGDEEPVPRAEREQPPLVGGVQRELGTARPAGRPARLHQQDGIRVRVHLEGKGEMR